MAMKRDWITEMMEIGLLTREQAEDARQRDEVPALRAPGAAGNGAYHSPATPRDGLRLLMCAPCNKAFAADGADTGTQTLCPDCGGPLRPTGYGRLNGAPGASNGSSVFGAETPFNGSPQPFGRYLLRRELGHGGMGIVWEALDTDLDRPVALKMLLAEGEELEGGAVERLLREARAAARLRHPGIVGILDIGQTDGRHYFTMDLVDGKSFEKLLRDPGLSERRRVEIVAVVAEALGTAHAEGIVHRDVKPSNIIVDARGRPVLVDFGLARDGASGVNVLTRTGALVGTPHYMSPEQACLSPQSARPPSDVFSLGVVLFRALTGRLPFQRDNVQVLLAILHEQPAVPSSLKAGIPRDLDTICLKCLEKRPERRYPDGAALAADIRRWLAGTPIESRPVSRTRSFFRRLFHRFSSETNENLRRADEERAAAVEQARAQVDALKKLERARPALEQARGILYDREGTAEDLIRRVDAAQSLIEQALARCPDLALGYYLLARALALRGHDGRAESAWRRAIQLDPDFGPAHFHLGSHIVEHAIFEFLSWPVEERPPQEDELRRRLAEGDAELAKALQLGSGFEDEARRQLALAMGACARGDIVRAAELCRDGIRRFPRAEGREIFHWMIGFCSADLEKRIHGWDGALDVRPHHLLSLTARGNAKAQLGRWSEALADLDESIRLRPWNLPALLSRGIVRSRLGDAAGARVDLGDCLKLQPELAGAREDFGRALSKFAGKLRGAPESAMAADATRGPCLPC